MPRCLGNSAIHYYSIQIANYTIGSIREDVLSVDHEAKFSTHITLPYNEEMIMAFFSEMKNNGYEPDVLGLSVYPTENNIQTDAPADRMSALKDIIEKLYKTFDKPVFIAEFGYPSAPMTGAFANYNKVDGDYALTPQGQAKYLYDLTQWGLNNGLSGIRCWAPDFIIPDWIPFSVFSAEGNKYIAKPSLDAMKKAIEESK